MALDNYLEPEVAIAVAVTAAVASPPVRKVLRKGAVYGLAGLLIAGDRLAAAGRNVAQGARSAAASAGQAVSSAAGQGSEPAHESHAAPQPAAG
jgi:hypothetical protein